MFLQVQLKHCLENMLNIESEKNWETEDEPEILNGYYHSEIQIDITEVQCSTSHWPLGVPASLFIYPRVALFTKL